MAPAACSMGRIARSDAGDGRARRRRAAQGAERPRTEVQDVARVHRQERGRAAEEHGEEIERDGAEDDLVAPHVAHAGEQRGPRRGRPARGRRARLHRSITTTQAPSEQPAAERVDPGGPAEGRVEQAAERRSEHHGGLPERRAPRDGVAEVLGRHERRQERLVGRAQERARHADPHEHGVDRARRRPFARGQREERRRQRRHRGVAGDQDARRSTRSATCPVTRDRPDGGEELREPHPREVDRAARDRVDLPPMATLCICMPRIDSSRAPWKQLEVAVPEGRRPRDALRVQWRRGGHRAPARFFVSPRRARKRAAALRRAAAAGIDAAQVFERVALVGDVPVVVKELLALPGCRAARGCRRAAG